MKINSNVKNYSVQFIDNLWEQVSKSKYDLIFIDSNLSKLYLDFNNFRTIAIDCKEKSKNIETVAEIVGILKANGIKKNSLIAVVGGGIIQDLLTFGLSIYMRGLSWHFYPTTLQSMIDSCIGGKSSLNFGDQKNLLGNFFPPDKIHIYINFLKTLEQIEVTSGLIEGVKIVSTCGLVQLKAYSAEVKNVLEKYQARKELKLFESLILKSLEVKKSIIEKDEFDQNIRKTLNFGHTFGHVIESISDFKINHGLAVGLGMLSAIHFQYLLYTNKIDDFNINLREITLFLLKPHRDKFKVNLNLDLISNLILNDKKNAVNYLTLILPVTGIIEIKKLPLDNVILNKVEASIEYALKEVING